MMVFVIPRIISYFFAKICPGGRVGSLSEHYLGSYVGSSAMNSKPIEKRSRHAVRINSLKDNLPLDMLIVFFFKIFKTIRERYTKMNQKPISP